MNFDPIDIAKKHIEKLKEYRTKLPPSSIKRALCDPHSKRLPRYCGLTVHFATGGCPYRCSYCYIYDMGYTTEPRPYPLAPEELAFAILSNKNFISGRYGTLLAVGSVTEPFLYEDLAISYIKELSKLENPIQFSTKKFLTKTTTKILSGIKAPICPLVTIVTIEYVDVLEPYAPSIDLRLKTIENLKDAGLRVFLFLRPIIIGINYKEAFKIIDLISEYNIDGVVIGSFRITQRIYRKLRNLGLNLEKALSRVNQKLLSKYKHKQFTVPLTRKEKNALISYIRRRNLIPFKSACCANSYNAGVICPSICYETNFCTQCPNQCSSQEPPGIEKVEKALRILGLSIKISKRKRGIYTDKKFVKLVQTLSRRIAMPHKP